MHKAEKHNIIQITAKAQLERNNWTAPSSMATAEQKHLNIHFVRGKAAASSCSIWEQNAKQ